MGLSPAELQRLREAFAAAIGQGLRADGQAVAALPAHVRAPQEPLNGRVVVIDTGGTNMRAAVARYDNGAARVEQGPVTQPLPFRTQRNISAADFFDAQAALTEGFNDIDGLGLGYCFSYPSASTDNGDARLLRWTKGIQIPDVVGTEVGAQLTQALQRRGTRASRVVVLNDTVAALVAAGAISTVQDSRHAIGLIVGTGTNMAAHFDGSEAPKLQAPELAGWSGPMAVNLESGNFTPPGLTPADDTVDEATENPGRQRFEKAVSGHYLPFVFAAQMPAQTGFDPTAGSKQLSEFEPESEAARVASALLNRSADMVAAGLVAVTDQWAKAPAKIDVVAEGSLFWKTGGYQQRVLQRARQLWAGESVDRELVLHQTEHANLLGAAAAVLNRRTG